MRDRLIELLKQKSCVYVPCDNECGGCKNVEMYDDSIESIADHLLAEGVIVPPCKVGDTVYCIWQYIDFATKEPPFIKESKVASFVLDEEEVKVIPEDYAEMPDYWYSLLSVHFTREDAEKALEERSKE